MRTDAGHTITINRAPVLTLWASVVAEQLGHDRQAALSLGKALSGLNAQSKGRQLGIYHKREPELGAKPRQRAPQAVELMGRQVPVVKTPDGLRALAKGKPVSSESAERYIEEKFGSSLAAVRKAMEELAKSLPPAALAPVAYSLYERFRPLIPAGVRGWGAKGELDLGLIHELAKRKGSDK
jgi:hypothetical protein